MTFSVRSCLTTGFAVITAAAIAVASVPEPADRLTSTPVATHARVLQQPVQLTAAVQRSAVQQSASAVSLPNLLTDWIRRISPSASATFPTPKFLPPVVSGTSISNGIKNVYNAVEPWVRWGFEVAAYAVGWIPWVGYLAPQIMIFYNLGERIVQSITFNIADWIGGTVSFAQGLRNVAVDTINSFIHFANDELAFFLPPLPPIPPIGGGLATATVATSLKAATSATDTVVKPAIADTVTMGSDGTPAEVPKHEDKTTPALEDRQAAEPEAVSEPTKTSETTADEPEAQPEPKSEVKPDATKAESSKPDTKPETKPDAPKADNDNGTGTGTGTGTDKADSPKADTDKPAPKNTKNTEPKKKKRDHRSSTPKADAAN